MAETWARADQQIRPVAKWQGERATLESRWDGRANSLGLLRLVLALLVLVSHSMPLGFGRPNIGRGLSGGQSDLGTLAVYGFFIVSGFLVSGSAQRLPVGRFLWHRFIRIYPGLWISLLFTALILAPFVALVEGVPLVDLTVARDSPIDFLKANWTGSVRQYTIGGLLSGTPYGGVVGGPSAFIGSWWSLRYEVGCYIGLAVLSAFGLLRFRWVVGCLLLSLGSCCWALILMNDWSGAAPSLGYTSSLPLIGPLNVFQLLFLTYLFLIGACARLWSRYIPVRGLAAVLAAATFAATALLGGFLTVGLLAYAYLIFWLMVSLPTPTHSIGRRHDYSYGVYIYGFGVQQAVALLGAARWGFVGYVTICLICTLILAAASWRFVEEPALRWKDWAPTAGTWSRRRRAPRVPTP